MNSITFAKDIHKGLSAKNKYLSSKYFYDEEGSRLFQQIMELPEYYLTDAEMSILQTKSGEIFSTLNAIKLNIIELGAGDGIKTIEFLQHLTEAQAEVTYYPIDISKEAIDQLSQKVTKALPNLPVKPLVGDYFNELGHIPSSAAKNVILFLGANIGNYTNDKAVELLKLINANIRKGDMLIIGIDLKKNPALIASAYNDNQGVTRAFNLNLLTRINRELDGNFDMSSFDFYSTYNPDQGEIRSYLVSLKDQKVMIGFSKKQYHFAKNELIYTELSKKYNKTEINELAAKAGFTCIAQVEDELGYFADCLFEK